ncbi:MAG TPA: amidohydrolase/deacetylase family metallohydrolase [Puia sp.]|nr:amidohydrolase/deacetylase family metallohydrolase [Puia sp.]
MFYSQYNSTLRRLAGSPVSRCRSVAASPASRFRAAAVILLCLIGTTLNLSAQPYDLLLKGGHMIDPKNKIDGNMDLAITAGKIAQVAPSIPATNAKKVIDVTGLIVTPGIVDMHVHVFWGTDPNSYLANAHDGLPPDAFSFRAGVTTMVDCGSSGWRNFRQFKEQTIDRSQTRILAFINIVGGGMFSRYDEQNVDDMSPLMTANMITKLYPNLIVGIKSAHYWGDFTSVDKALQAGKMANVPVIVDFGEHDPPNSIEELFMKHFRPGDIFTHAFADGPKERETLVDDATGKVKPFVFEAEKKGVIFDVGHGGGAFAWRQAVPAIKQGLLPGTISSDLHTQSMNSGFKDMTNLMSKFLNIGMTLQQVIEKSTWAPALVIKHPELGNLSVGSEADVAVFSIRKGNFGFMDTKRTKQRGTQKLEAELTLRAGKIVWDLNGLSVPDWDQKPAN